MRSDRPMARFARLRSRLTSRSATSPDPTETTKSPDTTRTAVEETDPAPTEAAVTAPVSTLRSRLDEVLERTGCLRWLQGS